MRFMFLVSILGSLGCSTSQKEVRSVITDDVTYAKSFHFEQVGEQNHLVIDQPWPGASEAIRYDLGKLPTRFVCTSTSHLPFFELLGAEESVIGFPNLAHISSKVFIERGEKALLNDLGPDGSINLELLISLNPDAVIAYDMGSESPILDKIKEVGIPVYYNSDFLEKTPLGRAEWIKFFGALLGKEQEADSIFRAIEAKYKKIQTLVEKVDRRPSILSGVVYGDTWFLPGGQNWAATFFKDAGGEYLWSSDTTSGWKELSFEAVYEKAHGAEFWIGTSTTNTREELIGQDGRYGGFKAYQNDKVYNYNKRIGPNGGYDFFESGYSRPDLVLSDLTKILHPELLPDYETVYFKKLND